MGIPTYYNPFALLYSLTPSTRRQELIQGLNCPPMSTTLLLYHCFAISTGVFLEILLATNEGKKEIFASARKQNNKSRERIKGKGGQSIRTLNGPVRET